MTSRPQGDYEIDGESCWFVSHERMLDGLENNEFLDVGEHDNYLFGTTLDSIRAVMAENKLCVLDVRPEVSWNAGSHCYTHHMRMDMRHCGYCFARLATETYILDIELCCNSSAGPWLL